MLAANQKRFRIFFLILAGLSAASGSMSSSAALEESLTLYASFDRGIEPDYAFGSSVADGGGELDTGKVGQSLVSRGLGSLFQGEPNVARLDNVLRNGIEQGMVFYPVPGNFDVASGTLAFWYLPPRDFDETGPSGAMVDAMLTNFAITKPQGRASLVFMTGANPGDGDVFAWDYGCQAPTDAIRARRWVHVAVSWDRESQQKRLYLDGRLAASNQTELIRPSGGSHLVIGALHGRYDELGVWSRPLTDTEIAMLAREPQSLASAASRVDTLSQSLPDWPLYPSLVSMTNHGDSLVTQGNGFTFDLPVANRSESAVRAVVRVQAIDVFGVPQGKPVTRRLAIDANQSSQVSVTLRPEALGWYRANVTVEADGVSRSRDVTSFAVLPEGTPPRHRFFGGHMVAGLGIPDAARRLGVTSNRMHNMTQFSWWIRMQPEPGPLTIPYEEAYQRFNKLGFDHYAQWFGTPSWAARLPDGSVPPPQTDYPAGYLPHDMDAFRHYIRESMRLMPEVRDWEFWNEPYVGRFFRGSAQDYVRLLAVAYRESKSQNPDIRVFAQVQSEGPWLREALLAGVLEHCDGLAIHGYIPWDMPTERVRIRLTSLRDAIREHTDRNPDDFDYIYSEGGVVAGPCLDGLDFPHLPPPHVREPIQREAPAAMMVKASVLMMAEDYETHHYYFYATHNPLHVALRRGSWSMGEVTNTPRPQAISRALFAWMLDGGQFVREVIRADEGLHAGVFRREDGKSLAVLWAEQGAKLAMHPQGRAYDLMGNTLISDDDVIFDGTPIYVISDLAPDALAQSIASADLRTIATQQVVDAEPGTPVDSEPYQIATELGAQHMHPVDLSSVANMGLADEAPQDGRGGWFDEGPFNDMRMLEPGRHEWLGVPFQIAAEPRSAVVLRGESLPQGPDQVTIPIRPRQMTEGLFFAHAMNWGGPQPQRIATCRVTYEDGEVIEVPIIAKHNVENYWLPRGDDEDSRVVVFKHPTPLESDHPWRFIRIWFWSNPRPGHGITSLTLQRERLPSDYKATYALLGVTVATRF